MSPRYRPEPPFSHDRTEKTAVLLVNLGTPEQPEPAAVRRYLAEFLSDPRVVEIPRAAWWPILHGIILRTRPRRSARKYASIWMPEGSPLSVWTQRQTQALAGRLGLDGVLVDHAMRYGQPSVASALDRLKAAGATRILVIPLYPQYCAATTGSVADAVAAWTQRSRWLPELRFVNDFHLDDGYLDALAGSLRQAWSQRGRAERLVLSFHGMPERTLQLGDPYHCLCHATARGLARKMGLSPEDVEVTFQSRFGRAAWLRPYTAVRLAELARAGVRKVEVMCPGFVSDCLETLEEIGIEARHDFLAAGGTEFNLVPCLNQSSAWIDALEALARRHLAGWPLVDARTPGDRQALARRAAALGAQDPAPGARA